MLYIVRFQKQICHILQRKIYHIFLAYAIIRKKILSFTEMKDKIIRILWSEPAPLDLAMSMIGSQQPGLYYISRLWGSHETSHFCDFIQTSLFHFVEMFDILLLSHFQHLSATSLSDWTPLW